MIIEISKHAITITAFVFVMMLLVEYLNVLTRGEWQKKLLSSGWKKYFIAALLGIVPGCLGPFMVVAMYSHRMLTFGALVTAMIATSGDETFVMLAMIPKTTFILSGVLLVMAIAVGALTDVIANKKSGKATACPHMEIHEEETCQCFPGTKIFEQWKDCSAARGVLTLLLVVLTLALIAGQLGPSQWNYIRITLLVIHFIALFIVTTVPDHFLEEHLWKHVARVHVPRIFIWTLGALVLMKLLTHHLHLENEMLAGKWVILIIACLVGLIPESGPHLIFVMLFAEGSIPFSILIASSIVQDGHGMLPLLAHSRRTFFNVKMINLLAGLLVGAIMMGLGF